MSKNYLLVIVFLISILTDSLAQTVPNAGSLLKQTEQGLHLNQPAQQIKKKLEVPEPMEQPGGLTVVVTEFKFTGNTLLSSDQLSRAVAPFLNKELTFSQLKQSAEAVADAYRDLGWIVRAYLPKW